METKPWYKSRTIWIAILMALMSILPLVNALVAALSQAQQDPVAISAAVTTFIGSVLVIVVRFGTNTTIS